MTYELLVGLHVVDDALYAHYREAMAPLLAAHGGGFRHDFAVGKTLRSEAAHPINRVFTIHFADRARREAFFAHSEYLAVRKRWFEPAVRAATILAEYER